MKYVKSMFVVLLLFSYSFSQEIDERQSCYFNPFYEIPIINTRLKIDSIMNANKIPGLSIAVGNNEKILWAEGFGFADIENDVQVKINSKFRIGSISKVFSALATAKLYEEELLDLDKDIRTYIPYFPEKKYMITVRQLAGHTAGIRHYNNKKGEFFSRKKYDDLKDAISIFKDDSLLFKPETKYFYTTYGFNLIGAVIEAASNLDFVTYLETNIFKPFKMFNTCADFNEDIINNRVEFYSVENDTLKNAYYVDNSNKMPGGGFMSTPLDIVKMGIRILSSDFFKKETLNLMFTSQKLKNGKDTGYGIGWFITKDTKGRKIVHHTGSSVGGRSIVLMYPEKSVILAMAANINFRLDKKVFFNIASQFIKE